MNFPMPKTDMSSSTRVRKTVFGEVKLLGLALLSFSLGIFQTHAQAIYQPWAVSTFAGSPKGAAGYVDSTAKLNGAQGVTVDSAGNLYINDTGNSVVDKVDTAGNMTLWAGVVGSNGGNDGQGTNAHFNQPAGGIAVDSAGNVYVTDTQTKTIRKIDTARNVTTIAGTVGVLGSSDGQGTNAQFNTPAGLVLGSGGNIYVADTGNNTIRKIDPAFNVTTVAGQPNVPGTTDGQGANALFNSPSCLAMDSAGNLYVTDSKNDTIRKIDTAFNVTTIAGQAGVAGATDAQGLFAAFSNPYGIAVDKAGNLYVGDYNNQAIRKIDTAYNVTTIAGVLDIKGSTDGNGTSAFFNGPRGVTVDSAGNLYVADSGNDTIRKIDTNDNVTTYLGQAGKAGPITKFNIPCGITRDTVGYFGLGNLFVAEENNVIRKITPAGYVTTFAGNGTAGHADGQGTNATFKDPFAVCFDKTSTILWVADTFNYIIRTIDSNANVVTVAGAGVNGSADGQGLNASWNIVEGMYVDPNTNIWFTDTYNHTIRKMDAALNVTTIAGQVGTIGHANGQGANATFNYPDGIVRDNNTGNLYVLELNNYDIRMIDTNYNVTTIAGQPGVIGNVDGPGLSATFYAGCGITMDSHGNLYVGGQYGDTIRMIDNTPAHNVVTLAGSFTNAGPADGVGPTALMGHPHGMVLDASANRFWSVGATDNRVVQGTIVITLTVTPSGPNQDTLTWPGSGALQSSANVNGPYTTIVGASSPYVVSTVGPHTFYRVVQ